MKTKQMIIGTGEILWDVFPDERKIGGAPANFVFYVSRLGHKAALISRVGTDSLGNEALATCRASGLKTDFIQKDRIHPTGKVRVELNSDGKPRFEIEENAAWDFLEEEKSLSQLAKEATAICFGTLAQRHPRSRMTIRRLLASAAPDCLKVLDLNLRPPYYDKEIVISSLEMADVLKLNSDELEAASRMFSLKGTESEWISALIQRFSLRVVALTAGDRGSRILSPEKESFHPGYRVPVVDTVGAGDAFTAALVHGLLANMSLDETNELANRLASSVCTRKGAWVDTLDLEHPLFRR